MWRKNKTIIVEEVGNLDANEDTKKAIFFQN